MLLCLEEMELDLLEAEAEDKCAANLTGLDPEANACARPADTENLISAEFRVLKKLCPKMQHKNDEGKIT